MGIKKIVVDANVLLALIDKNDKWHSEAKKIAKKLKKEKWEIIYLDCVINEVVSVLGKRLEEHKKSKKFKIIIGKLENLISEEDIEWIYPEVPAFYSRIIQLTKEKYGRLNFHDALIALFMKNYRLKYLLSFDKDFDEIEWIIRIAQRKNRKNKI